MSTKCTPQVYGFNYVHRILVIAKLSVQNLDNKTNKVFLYNDGDIDDLENAVWTLTLSGILSEIFCPLTLSLNVKRRTTALELIHKLINIRVF